jgi:aromatic ring-opening dioxygenase LigB subunit
MRKQIQELKERFKVTMTQAAEIANVSPSELTRDDYIRICVDNDISGRLNKEHLGAIGTFKTAKDELFSEIKTSKMPKILAIDIETKPLTSYIWSIWQDKIPLNMVINDWSILSYAAKWVGEDKIFYNDVRSKKDYENDQDLLKEIWKLLDEADIVLTQNGVKFDIPRINTRFLVHGMQPPSSYKHIDTLKLAKKYFNFTSNSLEYMTKLLCKKKKISHEKYPGFELWKECLNGNKDAWDHMREYNIADITSLEELYTKLAPWDNAINFSLYNENTNPTCSCGYTGEFKPDGFFYTKTSKFQKYKCPKCGREIKDSKNSLSKGKKQSLKS